MIKIVKDKNLIYDIPSHEVILVGTSINNTLGNGFQYQVKKAFPDVDEANKNTPYGDHRKLGTVTVVKSEGKTFCLCYINKSRRRPDLNPDYLDYDALRNVVQIINTNFKGKTVVSTILGLSEYEGDGDRERILKILEENSSDINLVLYDFEQPDRIAERKRRWNEIISSIGKVPPEEYREMKKLYHWQEHFGVLKPIPEGLSEYDVKQLIKEDKENHNTLGKSEN